VQLESGEVVAVQNIVKDRMNEVHLIYRKFHNQSSFFTYPLSSADIGIYQFSNLVVSLHHCLASNLQVKYCVLPYKTLYVAFPLLHSRNQ
jgi:hypothetical protein